MASFRGSRLLVVSLVGLSLFLLVAVFVSIVVVRLHFLVLSSAGTFGGSVWTLFGH